MTEEVIAALEEADESEEQEEQEEEVQEEVKEESKEEAKEEPKDDKFQRTVPYGALHQERQRRKEAERAHKELMSRVDQMFAAKEEKKAPDRESDPVGAIMHEIDEIKSKLGSVQETNKATAQEKQIDAVRDAVVRSEQAFVSSNPDYYSALAHLQNSMIEEEMDAGLDDDEAVEAVQKRLAEISIRALRSNRNPAEIAYKTALRRGFSSNDKMETIERGQRKSLSQAGGAPKGKMTPKEALALPKKDFDALIKDKDRFRALFE